MPPVLKIGIVSITPTLAAGVQPLTPAAGAVQGVSLRITATKTTWRSGAAVPVRATFVNHGKLPFVFTQEYSARYTFVFRGKFGPQSKPAAATRFAKRWGRRVLVSRSWAPPLQIVAVGKKAGYRCAPNGGRFIFAGRYLDLTMPGKYRIRLLTKYGMRKFAGDGRYITTAGGEKFGRSLLLNQDTVGPPPYGKRIAGNWIGVTILPPYGHIPKLALVKLRTLHGDGRDRSGIGLALVRSRVHSHVRGAILRRIRVDLFNTADRRRALRLTGDPLADFARIEITGPSYPGEFTVVKLPKPHDVAFIRKSPTPLTAYGRWLAEHPPGRVKWKTYRLKPGGMYRYAEPINLSCMYDMSLSGVYRVRIELAHPRVWSNWVNVDVPDVERQD